MGEQRVDAFFYGLFMDVDLLRAKGAAPATVQPAAAPGYALRIGNRATLVADAASVAHGMLMQLSHEDIDKLYSEPSVSMYRPEAILVLTSDGTWTPALTYNLTAEPAPEERNADYARKLRELAQRLRLPAEYIATIR